MFQKLLAKKHYWLRDSKSRPALGRVEVLVSSPTKLKKQEPRRGWNRAIKNTATQTVRLRAMQNTKNQSGYEPLNLENRSFVNSDNFDATDWNFWEIVQNPINKSVAQQLTATTYDLLSYFFVKKNTS